MGYDDFYIANENIKISFNKMLNNFSHHIGETKGMHYFLRLVNLSEQMRQLDKHKQLTIMLLFRMQGFWSGIEDYKNNCRGTPVFKVREIYFEALIVKYNIQKLIEDITKFCKETFEKSFTEMTHIFGTKSYNKEVASFLEEIASVD